MGVSETSLGLATTAAANSTLTTVRSPDTSIIRSSKSGPTAAQLARDTAENLGASTEAKVEQRRQNAEDAKSYRTASVEVFILTRVPLADVHAHDLPRDRLELDVVA